VRRCSRCTHPAYRTDRYCLNCGQPLGVWPGRWRWLAGCLLLLLCAAGAKVGGLAGAPVGAASRADTPAQTASAPMTHAVATSASTTACAFVLGFKALHDLMPARVGVCRDNERYDPTSGDAVQHTSGGLLVWRKADNGTAFTDGSQTWVLGPLGLQQRPNGRRFRWEANPAHLPTISLAIA
jgi:hypothetical protein